MMQRKAMIQQTMARHKYTIILKLTTDNQLLVGYMEDWNFMQLMSLLSTLIIGRSISYSSSVYVYLILTHL